MRNPLTVAALAVTLSCASSSPPQNAAPPPQDAVGAAMGALGRQLLARLPPQRPRVAVLPMRCEQTDESFGTYLADKLIAALLLEEPSLVLAERGRLKEALEEHVLSQYGVLDPGTTSEVGQFVGAEILILGTATVLEDGVDILARAVTVKTAEILAVADARIPRNTLGDHIDRSTPVAPAPPLALSTMFVSERDVGGTYEKVLVRDESILKSGDGLKIGFETNRDAHVYVLLLDSESQASVIFPNPDISTTNKAEGGKHVEIPPGDTWFFLDENTGRETIYILASVTPLPNVADLVSKLQAMGAGRQDAGADEAVAAFIRPTAPAPVTRGIGGIRKGRQKTVKLSDGRVVEQATDMLAGSGAVVRAVSFLHQ